MDLEVRTRDLWKFLSHMADASYLIRSVSRTIGILREASWTLMPLLNHWEAVNDLLLIIHARLM